MEERQGWPGRLLRQPAFPLVLAAGAAALLAWPLLTTPVRSPLVVYGFQFALWALLVGGLYALARALARRPPPAQEEDGPDG